MLINLILIFSRSNQIFFFLTISSSTYIIYTPSPFFLSLLFTVLHFLLFFCTFHIPGIVRVRKVEEFICYYNHYNNNKKN